MPRKKKQRISTQNEVRMTSKLLNLHLRNHPENKRLEAIDECLRSLKSLRDEEESKRCQMLIQAERQTTTTAEHAPPAKQQKQMFDMPWT